MDDMAENWDVPAAGPVPKGGPRSLTPSYTAGRAVRCRLLSSRGLLEALGGVLAGELAGHEVEAVLLVAAVLVGCDDARHNVDERTLLSYDLYSA